MPTTLPYQNQPLQRTQISLPLALRRQIDQIKKPQESLAEFIRQAVELKINQQQQEQADRQTRIQAAKAFIGSLDITKHPEWSTPEKISQWQREIRQDRPSFLKILAEREKKSKHG